MRTLAIAILALAGAADGQVEGKFERTLKVSGPADLDIVTDAGGIAVRNGNPGVVEIRGFLKGRNSFFGGDVEGRIRELEAHPPIEQSGSRIRIGYGIPSGMLRNISMRLEVIAPAESRATARTDSGGIHVEGLKGPLECKADSGGIEAFDIGSEVRATTDSGGIRLRNIQGGVYARADSGGIEAHGVAGAVDLATDSGGVRVTQTAAAPVRIRADSGGATVGLAPGAGYELRASSDSGRITVPEMTVRGTMSPHRAEGKVRGGGPLVDVHVDSGTIHIQ